MDSCKAHTTDEIKGLIGKYSTMAIITRKLQSLDLPKNMSFKEKIRQKC